MGRSYWHSRRSTFARFARGCGLDRRCRLSRESGTPARPRARGDVEHVPCPLVTAPLAEHEMHQTFWRRVGGAKTDGNETSFLEAFVGESGLEERFRESSHKLHKWRNTEKAILDSILHPPGVEPGARPWEDPMLPLHHECYIAISITIHIDTSLGSSSTSSLRSVHTVRRSHGCCQ